jgi:hypothetical protein
MRRDATLDTCAGCWRVGRTYARADVRRVVQAGTALAVRDPLRRRAGSGRDVPGQRHCVTAGNAIRINRSPVVRAAGRRRVRRCQGRRTTAAVAERCELSLPSSPVDATGHRAGLAVVRRDESIGFRRVDFCSCRWQDPQVANGCFSLKCERTREENERRSERDGTRLHQQGCTG